MTTGLYQYRNGTWERLEAEAVEIALAAFPACDSEDQADIYIGQKWGVSACAYRAATPGRYDWLVYFSANDQMDTIFCEMLPDMLQILRELAPIVESHARSRDEEDRVRHFSGVCLQGCLLCAERDERCRRE